MQIGFKPLFIYNTNKMGSDGHSTIHEAYPVWQLTFLISYLSSGRFDLFL